MLKIAIVGTQGVPANYGGFESLVENLIGENCPDDIRYTVFCSWPDTNPHPASYKGADLKYVRLHANGMQSIPYDIISMCRALRGYDVILILGVSGCLFLPVLRRLTRARIIVNIDGLEHRREKWGTLARTVLRQSEAMAVRYADAIVADNQAIWDYVLETYGKRAELIAYGGDHVYRDIPEEKMSDILASHGLQKGRYAISVCRIEPENNCHLILEAFSKVDMPLVFIGNWGHSDWSRFLWKKYERVANIHITHAIYDLDILYTLRSNAALYLHGHSAGGTNPSLVEAMHFGIPILTHDVVYNRATTEGRAYYFNNVDELISLAGRDELDGSRMREIARREYTWKNISDKYVRLFRRSKDDRKKDGRKKDDPSKDDRKKD